MKYIDYFLDRITMYRLVLYFLIILVLIAIGLSSVGILHFSAVAIAVSASYLTLVCWLINKLFARLFNTPVNTESAFITALILTLIFSPINKSEDLIVLAVAGGLAIASKFLISVNKKHIFNPAAFAAVLLAFGPKISANWWVGSTALLPYVLIGGLLIFRKIEREAMVSTYLLSVLASTTFFALVNHQHLITDIKSTFLNSAVFFLAFIMLPEPQTSPVRKDKQIWYGFLVGILFSPQVHIGSLYSTPELTLLAGNIYAYLVNPKYNLLPKLKEKLKIAPDIYEFVFAPEKPIKYIPGQYMEWTVSHNGVDGRGNRRYFTLASSPTEKNLRLGIKFYNQGSSFKRAINKLNPNATVAAGHLGGDFVMPKNTSQKLAFIAGGIGITPYRSMVKYLLDNNEKRDITLIYSEKNEAELVYRDIFDQATQKLGLKIMYTLTDENAKPANWKGHRGVINGDLIKRQIPDFMDRNFYISGPHSMVQAVETNLKEIGVPRRQIKTDLFPGYA